MRLADIRPCVHYTQFCMDWQALLLTFRLAAVTTAILLCLAVPLAAWLALSRSRWKTLVEAVAGLPLVLPPAVLGFYLLVLLGPVQGPGHELGQLLGRPLAFTFSGLVIGSVIYSFPFALQPLVAGFSAVDADLVDAARLLGARRWRLVSTIMLPLAKRSLLTAAMLGFLHTLGEFGVVLMVGGDIPGVTRTLSTVLYDQTQKPDYAAANQTALMLLIFCFVGLMVVYILAGKKRTGAGQRVGAGLG